MNIFVNNTAILQPNGIIYDAYDGINPRLVMVSWGRSSAAIKLLILQDSTMTTFVNYSIWKY